MLPSRACWLAKASDKPKEATASGGGEGAGEQVGAGDSDKLAGESPERYSLQEQYEHLECFFTALGLDNSEKELKPENVFA